MPYWVVIKRKAQKQLDRIQQEDRTRIIGAVFDLGINQDRWGARVCRDVPVIASESATTGQST